MTTDRERAEPIEDYLDELMTCLRLPPRAARRLLSETEDHLQCAAEEAQQGGTSRIAAEREAVSRFGPAARVAAEARSVRRIGPVTAVGHLSWSGVALGGVGLVGVGVSGVLAAIFNAVFGRRFVGALPQAYQPAACHHFLAVQPEAGNCNIAAIFENSHDAVALRLAAGCVGLVLVLVAWWTRRYLRNDSSFRRLLDASLSVLATLSFGAAAVALCGMSIDVGIHYGTRGIGWYLSGGLVSLAGALIAAGLSWHHLRFIRPWNRVAVMT